MRGYLLDTNIIDYWYDENCGEKHRYVLAHIQSLPQPTPLAISVITLGEIEYGCRVVSPDGDTRVQAALKAFVRDKLPRVLKVTRSTTLYYGSLRARLFDKFAPKKKRVQGMRPEQLRDPITSRELGVQENDIWIAAQGIEYNLVLVTADKMSRLRDVLGGDVLLDIADWSVEADSLA